MITRFPSWSLIVYEQIHKTFSTVNDPHKMFNKYLSMMISEDREKEDTS